MANSSNFKAGSQWRDVQRDFWRLAEGRAIFEWQTFYLLQPLLKRLPRGDGHSVIVFPGFLASDRSTAPMRNLLSKLGYDVHGWQASRNMGLNPALEAQLPSLLKRVFESTGNKVSLIGWSLGGVYARELAKAFPEKVRCVITLGSPISGRRNRQQLFRPVKRNATRPTDTPGIDLNTPPPVPTTSIYSRTDGIVFWRASVQKEDMLTGAQKAENVELPASHLGLGVNALAMIVIADRLAQNPREWKEYSKPSWQTLLACLPEQSWVADLRKAIFS